MKAGRLADKTHIRVNAISMGERLDLRPLDMSQRLAVSPVVVSAGSSGCAALFRYGVVVLFGLEPVEEAAFLTSLRNLVQEPYREPKREETEIRILPDADEHVDNNGIVLREASLERIQIVADILAKSVVLERYETTTAEGFESIEPLAVGLKRHGRARTGTRQLLRNIGEALLIEHRMVNRVEVGEKPELLWEQSELDPLYLRLEKEYELPERRIAVERKLELVARTVETVLDLLNHSRSLRVEWYIVILIVIEIVLTLYGMWLAH